MRRTTRIITLCAVAALLLTSCQERQERKVIEKVAYNYLDAMANFRIDDAVPYASKQTREETIPFAKNFLLANTDSSVIIASTPATIVIDSINVANDTATISYTQTNPLRVKMSTITAIKEEGQWVIDVPLMLPSFMNGGAQTDSLTIPRQDTLAIKMAQ